MTIFQQAFSQDRISLLEQELESLKIDIPALENKIEISVDEIELEEFLRGIAHSNKINISVDPGLDFAVSNNFIDVEVADILIFLAREYDLNLEFQGSIISVSKYEAPVETPPPPIEKLPVTFNANNKNLSLDFSNIPLSQATKEITRVSGNNVITETSVDQVMVSSYIIDVPFATAMEKFAFSNNLSLSITGDNFYILSKKKEEKITKATKKKPASFTQDVDFEFNISENNLINLKAIDQPISSILKVIGNELNINYYLVSDPKVKSSVNLKNFSFDQLLEYLFSGSDYTYKKQNGLYLIGQRKQEDLRETRLVQLQHRSVEGIASQIPESISKDVFIEEFNELNSVVLSGSKPSINEIEQFLWSVDKVVPVVLIEVMIIDYSKSHTVSTGINMGIGDKPAPPSFGSLYPQVDYNMNASSVNTLIESLNGYGWFKLGKVTPNFYFQIQALEDEGILKIRSTPRLATLNGNEANLSIGNTEYYSIQSNQVIGTQNPQNIITKRYESVSADLSVTIKPFVSGDEHITLEITVNQSDFTARPSPEAPPGSVSRSFSSLIRVKNEEMILLGGLEEKTMSNTGSGLPLLSRIPVLKWFFSSKTRSRSSDRLNIFIKPTVFY